MIIGIDGNEANEEMRVGVHQYSYEMLVALYNANKKSKNKNSYIIYLKKSPGKHLPKENDHWNYLVLSGGRVWIIAKLMPELIRGRKVDVFYSPGHYLPLFAPMPTICTIHDVGYLNSSGYFRKYDFWQLKLWSAISIIISKYIIAVSDNTAKDIVRHYKITPKKVKVIYEAYDKARYGINVSHQDVRRITKKYHIGEKYILFLGALKPSKNIERIIEGFGLLNRLKEFEDRYQLVIAGKKGWMYESIFEKVKKLNLQNRVIFTGYVSEEDKPALMGGADVFVSPSLYEGFGLTMLESMACGTPVITSKAGSIPEVVGDSGIYCNELDANDIMSKIKMVLSMDTKMYNKLVEKSLSQAEKFDWDNSASNLIGVFEKIRENGE